MGIYLSTPNTEKHAGDGSSAQTTFGFSAMQGWRSNMEDEHVAAANFDGKGGDFFAVYDGHGGQKVAEFAGTVLHKEMVENSAAWKDGDVEAALKWAYIHCDDLVRHNSDVATMNPTSSGASSDFVNDDYKAILDKVDCFTTGCTAVSAVLKGRDLWVANAGDSRCVLCRAGGKEEPMTFDHKTTDDIEKDRIIKAGGWIQDGRVNSNLNLTRALGDLKYKMKESLPPEDQIITCNPDLKHVTLNDGDEFILLACDGVWDVKTNQEAVDFVRTRLRAGGKSHSEILSELLDDCLAEDIQHAEGKGCDNMTAVLAVFKSF